jgi:hypothetical protein
MSVMTAAIRAPHPHSDTDVTVATLRPSVRLVDPAWFPEPPAAEPAPLRLIPGGRDAALRRRRTAAVYRRRRWVAASLAVVLVFAVLAGARALEQWALADPGRVPAGAGAGAEPASPAGPGSASPAASGAVPTPTPGDSHVVAPGDTVWSIARSLAPEGDIRPVVDELVERSGGGALQVGQRLDLTGLAP